MLTIVDNGLSFQDGNLRYAFFEIEKDGRRFFRCVALKELLTIPASEREDYELLSKHHMAVRGLHNAGINFVYAAMGIYSPEHVGIVQYFGAAGEGASQEEAARIALVGAGTVEAVLANFPQTKLGAPHKDWLQWYLDFITTRARNIAAVLGHPDPRTGRMGLSSDGTIGEDSDTELSQEQNEILFRGLSKLRQNFVFQVLAEHETRQNMTTALLRVAEVASNVASRRKGSVGIGFSLGIPLMAALAQNQSTTLGAGQGTTHSVSDGVSQAWGSTHALGHTHATGETSTVGESQTVGESRSSSYGTSHGTAHTTSHASTSGHGSSSGGGYSEPAGGGLGDIVSGIFHGQMPNLQQLANGIGVNISPEGLGISRPPETISGFSSSSSFSSSTSGVADSTMQSAMQSQGHATMEAHTSMQSQSQSVSDANSVSDAVSRSASQSHAVGEAVSQNRSVNEGQGVSAGLSTGLLPGLNINRSWHTEDDVADRVTEVLRKLEALANQASAEGGFMANAWLFTETEEGDAAASALVPQAFHGVNVPTPVLTIKPLQTDEAELRAHAFSFTPWTDLDDGDPFSGCFWTRYATMLTAGQLAAYTAPGLFEEGSASTTMSKLPQEVGFYPNMPGDVVMGHQYSPETGDLTTAQVRLDPETLMHTMAAGDTGFGKSVAMIRLAYETTLRWKIRTVVLDFGAGWRTLLNAPGLEGHVEILQLWPDAVRPMRWNPMQIGRNIAPETQWRAFADVFGGIAQLGVKRQKQELLEAMRRIYGVGRKKTEGTLQDTGGGVLVDDPEVRASEMWGRVRPGEADMSGAGAGTLLGDLSSSARQALAVQRSSTIGFADLYQNVQDKLKTVPPRDTMLTGVLEGILFRLNPLVQGAAALQFAPGLNTVPIEDLSKQGGWGVTIIEGGMFLDEFGKAFLLGWTGWHIYMDMVARRVHEVNEGEPLLQVIYEEANKIFVKDQGSTSGDEGIGGISATQRFADMFRDARKYKCRLHVITQAPHLLADDIVSSCSNLIVGYLKNPKDKDLVLAALARSEKGFHDEPWRRFLDDIPVGMAVGRLPYTTQREMQRPFLFKPLMLEVPEPSDEDIARRLGRIAL
ncbi:MAG TPA: serine-rich protein [Anaerolineales bacterium]|nr:serine-rich protein [Anaerolineales bacterium]